MLWDWLSASVDATRAHDISFAQSWHARFMVLAWGICVPMGVFFARYLKVMPGQNWPAELDNPFWWRVHLVLQNGAGLAMLAGFVIILIARDSAAPTHPHAWLGWAVLLGCAVQIASGYLRGSKGGPTEPAPDGSLRGDHFDMTPRRKAFEAVHKSLGYALLGGSLFVILQGLWMANAPRWMALALVLYWLALVLGAWLLRRRPRVSTYQAIWGPDPSLPGNREDIASGHDNTGS